MKSFEQFFEDNNEIQVGDRFVPLKRRNKAPLKLEPQAMDEPREAPVRSYVDPSVVDTAPKLDLRKDMELKLDKDAETNKMSDEQRISRLVDRNSEVYSQLRDNKLLQDRILGNADFAENFFGSEMFRDHFMDLERFNSERPENTTQMAMKPDQEGRPYPQRYQRDYGAGRLTGSRNAATTQEQPNWFEMHELDDEDKFYDYAKAVSRIMDRSYGDFMGGEDQTTGDKKKSRYRQGLGFRKGSEQGPKNELPMEEAIREWLGKFKGGEINDLSDDVDFSNPRHFTIADLAKGQGVGFDDITTLSKLFQNGSLDADLDDTKFGTRAEALAHYARQVGERRRGGSDTRSLRDFLKDPFFEAEDQKAGAREAGFDDDEIAQFIQDERIQHFPAGRALLGDRFGLDNSDYDWEDDDEVIDNMEDHMQELSNGMPLLPMIADMAFGEDSTSENRELAMNILAYQLGNAFEDDNSEGIWGNDPDAAAFGGYGLIDQDLDVDDLMKIAEMNDGAGFEETTESFIDNINRLRNLGYEEGTFYDEDNDNYNETELVSTSDMTDALRNSDTFEDAYDRVRSIINDNYDDVRSRIRDEGGEDYSEDGHRLEDLYPDGKTPDIEDVDGSENKSYKSDYTNFSLTVNNNPNEYGTHRYETLDADLENAGLTRKDLKKSVYIAWQAMAGKEEKAAMEKRYKAKTGKGADDPGFEPFARKVIAFNALKNWKNNVLPTLKPGTILYNTPIGGGAGGNMREVLYSKMGFGEYGDYGQQAVVGKDGRVYPIGPKSDSSLARRQGERAQQRAGRRPRNESMGEVMYWWQQNPWLSQEEILLVLDAI